MLVDFSNISLWGVIVAAVVPFILGFIWYAKPTLGKLWQKEAGLSEADMKGANMPMTFGLSFAGNLVMAYVMSGVLHSLSPNFTPWQGFVTSLLLGAGFSGVAMLVTYLFARRSSTLWMIDAGYAVLNLAVMGAVLGLFL